MHNFLFVQAYDLLWSNWSFFPDRYAILLLVYTKDILYLRILKNIWCHVDLEMLSTPSGLQI